MPSSKARRSLIRAIAAVPGLYALIAFLAARRVTVRGRSMLPALHPGDRILCDRLAYWRSPPRRGDIVLAVHPARPGVRMLKRIAATPGETFAAAGSLPRLLERGEYAITGDNPHESTDSRTLGPIGRRDIVARVRLLYWPPERFRRL